VADIDTARLTVSESAADNARELSSSLSGQIVEDPAECGDCVGVPEVPRVLVRLGFTLVPHAAQLIDHVPETLFGMVVSHAVEHGLETTAPRKCYQPNGRCRPLVHRDSVVFTLCWCGWLSGWS
jgi:hypothetical protein